MSEANVTSISERKLAANRANAQKSTGPKTQAGKDTARMNRLRHGLSAEIVCIPGEDPREYQAKRQSYAQFFEPKTQVELDLVEDVALSRWRMLRYARYEAALLHAAIEKFNATPQPDFDQMCPEVAAALAFQQLADNSKALDNLKRYEGSIRSAFNSAWRQLAALKKGDPPVPYPFPEPDSYPTEAIEPEPAEVIEPEPNEAIEPEPAEPTAPQERTEPTEPGEPAETNQTTAPPEPPKPQRAGLEAAKPPPARLRRLRKLRQTTQPGYHSEKSSVSSPLRGPC